MRRWTIAKAVQVFISYRRTDGLSAAQWLAEELERQFGADRVFIDATGIPAGANWLRTLQERVGAADVLLLVIGRRWADEAITRTHAGEKDVLLEELETARRAGAAIIPVLVEHASMPEASDLPRSFKSVPAMQYVELRPGEAFKQDIATLAARIKQTRREPIEPAPKPRARARRLAGGAVADDLADGDVVDHARLGVQRDGARLAERRRPAARRPRS